MRSENCLLCGRCLSDEESVERGLGPVCLRNLERRRLREVKGVMSPYESVGWEYTKRILVKHGISLDTLFGNTKEAVSDA